MHDRVSDGQNGFAEEAILRRIPLEILAVSAALSLPLVFLFDARTGLIFLAGGAFSGLSFHWLKQSITRLLRREKSKTLRAAAAFYILRLLLLTGIFFTIIFFFRRAVLAFAAGFSTVILVFLGEAASALSRIKRWKS